MSASFVRRVLQGAQWGLVLGVGAGLADGGFALRGVAGLPDRAGTMLVALGLHVLLFGTLGVLLAAPAAALLRRGAAKQGAHVNRSSRTKGVLLALGGATAVALVTFGPAPSYDAIAKSRAHPDKAEARPNILLISVDTLRADHVGAYDYGRKTTPNLDRLARQGTLFESAYSNASWTLPAHASMLTGLEPFAHGTCREQDRLPGGIDTLAEQLQRAGYSTDAWVGTDPFGYVGAVFGLAAGFDTYRHYPHPERFRSSLVARAVDGEILRAWGRDVGNARAEIDSVVRWLAEPRDRPFFLFVHLYDVHSKASMLPYEAPAPFLDQGCPGRIESFAACREGRCATDRLLGMANREEQPFGDEEIDVLECLYDGGVAFVDHELGRLFDALDSHKLTESSVVIVTADHGEAFFEHGAPLHTTLFEEVVRIPLIVRAPGMAAGKRASGIASLADITPTVLDLAGLTPSQDMQGRSLVEVLRDWPARAEGTLVGVSLGQTVYREGDMKYIERGRCGLPASGAAGSELYNLSKDRSELQNRAGWEADEVQRLAAALARRREASTALRKRIVGGAAVDRVELNERARARLRALGYLAEEEGEGEEGEEVEGKEGKAAKEREASE